MQTSESTHLIIYTVINAIPPGYVASYKQVATVAGLPNHARLVGRLLKALPADSTLPWHRVINSQGKISFPQNSEKYFEQHSKLLDEGVTFNKGKVNLTKFMYLFDQ